MWLTSLVFKRCVTIDAEIALYVPGAWLDLNIRSQDIRFTVYPKVQYQCFPIWKKWWLKSVAKATRLWYSFNAFTTIWNPRFISHEWPPRLHSSSKIGIHDQTTNSYFRPYPRRERPINNWQYQILQRSQVSYPHWNNHVGSTVISIFLADNLC